MRRTAAPLALLAVLAGIAVPWAGSAAPVPDADQRSCRAFVQEFYSWYLRSVGGTHPVSPEEAAINKRAASFSPELRRRLEEDRQAAAKSPGEIVGLDFDPFLNAQDVAQRYQVGNVSRVGAIYRANVYGTWNGKRNKKPDVIPELKRVGGRWVFVNFRYGTGKEKGDLLSVLKELREERQKPKR